MQTHGPHLAAGRRVRDSEAVIFRRPRGREADEESKLVRMRAVRRIDPPIANDEKRFLAPARAKGSRFIDLLEEDAYLGRDPLRDFRVRLEVLNPARTALDAVDDEQRQPPSRQALPVGGACGARREGAALDA